MNSSLNIIEANKKNYIYNELIFFNNAIIFLCFCFPLAKHIPYYINKCEMLERKINQYTNWNIFIIFCDYILIHYYNINNIFISKFIALNSFQIFIIYHCFVLYDTRVLFDNSDQNPLPLIGIDVGNYNSFLIKTEYFILNILLHILPLYVYLDYLLLEQPYGNELNMGIYTLLFKFFWALNVFGNFNVVTIYLPAYNGCHIKLFNVLIIFDYLTGVFFQYYINNKI